jgi:transposase
MHQLHLLPQDGTIYLIRKLSTRMKYTLRDLRVDFPDDQACMTWLVEYLYPNGITCKSCQQVTKFYPVKGRKTYACGVCGWQISPTAGTIFHKSRTPLTVWFHAIYLMSTTKAGTSAMEIMRQTGVTYKTAWRMMHQIRTMMAAPDGLLTGEVELDETFIHANSFKRSSARRRYGYDFRRTGEVIFGMVQRGGIAKYFHVDGANATTILPLIDKHIAYGTVIHTDGWTAYKLLPKRGYEHRSTDHSKMEFYTPDSSTQNIENSWSHLKRGIKGIYRHVSKKHLQKYADEYAWRYSNRDRASMFWALMCRIDDKKTTP